MAHIYLVRHGETDWNREHRFRGHTDVPLNEAGMAQAKALGQGLVAERQATAVYSSPLLRTMQTAQAIAAPLGLSVELSPGLKDMSFGEWEGRSEGEVAEQAPELYHLWRESPHTLRIPGGETLEDVQRRAAPAFEAVASKLKPADAVVLVSHDAVCRVLVLTIMGLGVSDFWRVAQENGAVNRFDVRNGIVRVTGVNDTCLLKGSHGPG